MFSIRDAEITVASAACVSRQFLEIILKPANVEREYGSVLNLCYQPTTPILLRTLDALHHSSARKGVKPGSNHNMVRCCLRFGKTAGKNEPCYSLTPYTYIDPLHLTRKHHFQLFSSRSSRARPLAPPDGRPANAIG